MHSSEPAKSNSLSKGRDFPNERIVLPLLQMAKSGEVEITHWGNDLRHDGLNGHRLHACRARKGSQSAKTCEYQNHGGAILAYLLTNARFPTIITSVLKEKEIPSASQSTCNSSDLVLLGTTSCCRLYLAVDRTRIARPTQ